MRNPAVERFRFRCWPEELKVGKRQVERGGVRVQSRVTEEPVEEQVRLREEHARAVTVTVGHSLGKDEAVRRLKHGFARTHGQLGSVIAMDQETWEGDSLRFRVRALGQTATGSIEVLEDALRIELSLPLLLAQAAKWPLPTLRNQATLLLDKK